MKNKSLSLKAAMVADAFEETEFSILELSPLAQVYADKCSKLTFAFFSDLSKLDAKMWKACKKLIMQRESYEHKHCEKLSRSIENLTDLLEDSNKSNLEKLDSLGEILNGDSPIYPLSKLKHEPFTEMKGISQVAILFYFVLRNLGEHLKEGC